MSSDDDDKKLLVCCDETCAKHDHYEYVRDYCAVCARVVWVPTGWVFTVAVCIPCFKDAKRQTEAS